MRTPRADQSRAVLLGVGSYLHPGLPAVPAVSRNVEDLRAVLCDPHIGVFWSGNCTPLIDPRSAYEIGRPLLQAARQAEDVFFVYYAGHGIVGPGGELYLATAQTDPDALLFSALPYASIREALRESPARIRIVVLDCCFSGRAIGQLADLDSAVLGQLAVDGTYLITATAANTPALAPDGASHTVFTGILLDILCGQTTDSPDQLTLGEICRQLRRIMLERGFPVPQQRGTATADLLVLSRATPHGHRPTQASPPQAHAADIASAPMSQRAVPEAVEEYLVGLIATAGQPGGRAARGSAGARRGSRGVARTARIMKTVVEERAGVAPGTPDQVVSRLLAAIPKARELPGGGDRIRFAVPLGHTGLSQAVIDLVFGPATPTKEGGLGVQVHLYGYCKEGLLSRQPTRAAANRVWSAVIG
jgi:hypothetical protein